MRKLSFRLFGLAVVLGIAVFTVGYDGHVVSAQASAASVLTNSSPPAQCGSVIFSDDFSNPNSGWFVGSGNQGFDWGYTNGEYRVLSSLPGFIAFSGAPTAPLTGGFCVEVDAKQLVQGSLSDRGEVGLFFGADFKARTASFFGIISPQEAYDVGIFDGKTGAKHLVQSPSSSIKPANNFNHLLVIAQDGQANFYVNDTFLTKVSLTTSGAVGVFVSTFADPNVNGHFDNFVIHGKP
jgi:hypothetical protein